MLLPLQKDLQLRPWSQPGSTASKVPTQALNWPCASFPDLLFLSSPPLLLSSSADGRDLGASPELLFRRKESRPAPRGAPRRVVTTAGHPPPRSGLSTIAPFHRRAAPSPLPLSLSFPSRTCSSCLVSPPPCWRARGLPCRCPLFPTLNYEAALPILSAKPTVLRPARLLPSLRAMLSLPLFFSRFLLFSSLLLCCVGGARREPAKHACRHIEVSRFTAAGASRAEVLLRSAPIHSLRCWTCTATSVLRRPRVHGA